MCETKVLAKYQAFPTLESKRAICAGKVRMLVVPYIKGKTGFDYRMMGFADNESK